MKFRLKYLLSYLVVLGCLLCFPVRADERPAPQRPRESSAVEGSPPAAGSPSPVVFTKGQQSFGDARVFGVAIADVDSDGDNDLFVANYIGPTRLWLNDGNGTFTDSHQKFEASAEQRAHDVATADLNGDSHADVFLACHDAPSKIFLNDGRGGFVDNKQSIGEAGDAPTSVVLGDVDCDGDVDAFLVFPRRPNRLWVNDGHGFFTMSDTEYGGRTSTVMAVADFNGDTFADLFLGFLSQPGEIWFNDGSGNFRDTQQAVGEEEGCEDVVTGDIDGDGDMDLVVANIEKGIGVWLNRGDSGTFVREGARFSTGTIKAGLLDADTDGDLDLIAAQMEEGNRLWLNAGSGHFISTDQLLGTTWAFCFAVGKLDSDNDLDVVIGSEVDGPHAATVYFCEQVE